MIDRYELRAHELGFVIATEIPKDNGLWLPPTYHRALAEAEFWKSPLGMRAMWGPYAGMAAAEAARAIRTDDEARALAEGRLLAAKPQSRTPRRYDRAYRSKLAWGDRLVWDEDALMERAELIDTTLDELAAWPEVAEPQL